MRYCRAVDVTFWRDLTLMIVERQKVSRGERMLRPSNEEASMLSFRWLMVPALLWSAMVAQAQPGTFRFTCIIESISADHSQLVARDGPDLKTITIEDQALKDFLKDWAKGDHATFSGTQTDARLVLKSLVDQSDPIPEWKRLGALIGIAAILGAIVLLISSRHLKELLFIGEDKRYSNSKCQLSLWFGALLVSYLATLILRRWAGGPGFLGNVNIPPHLAELSGLSALTFAAAKGITQSKVSAAIANAAPAAAAVAPQGAQPTTVAVVAAPAPTKEPAAAPNFPSDLLMDDAGRFDLGDFQMILITILALSTQSRNVLFSAK